MQIQIDGESILELVKGQAALKQSVDDLKSTLLGGEKSEGVIPELKTRVHEVEKKVWYFTGAGAAIGAFLGGLINFKK